MSEDEKKTGHLATLLITIGMPERDGRDFIDRQLLLELFKTLRQKEILANADIEMIIDQTRTKHRAMIEDCNGDNASIDMIEMSKILDTFGKEHLDKFEEIVLSK